MSPDTGASEAPLPEYDELPVVAGAPKGSSWGLWGAGDVFGSLNLLGPDGVSKAMAEVKEGKVFNLNLELEMPDPPLFSRSAFEHVVHGSGIGHDDELVGWNTQRSSQWDGFRHLKHPAWGFYNGVADEDHGVHHWARRGIAGRAVLADVARWRDSVGRPISAPSADEITMEDLLATLRAQGSPVRQGDILLVRTGWLRWYRSLTAPGREAASRDVMSGACGLRRGRATAAGIWNLHVAAIAADNPALEVVPFGSWDREAMKTWRDDPEAAADTMLHFSLLGLLGIPIGELFDLDALADHCAVDGRYSCLLTSAPLNLEAGVATPPNALALK
ncbi:MAG: cyclase family protein [Acidimicrobiales bacterium]